MANFQVDSLERAKAILKSKQVISEEGTYKAKHRVGEKIFFWEDGSEYKIVNTNIMTSYHRNHVIELLGQGEYQAATNKGLSFNANLDLAAELSGSIESTILVEKRVTKSGEEGLFITKMRPVAARKAESFSFETAFMSESPEIIVNEMQTA
jgi:hypothetical protein